MSIKTIKDSSSDLTEHIVTGNVGPQEFLDCETEFYKNGPTRLQLWDVSAADLKDIPTQSLQRFVKHAARLGEARPNGLTAVIVKSKLQYGLARVAEMLGEFVKLPFEFRIFLKREDAVKWLNGGLTNKSMKHADEAEL